MSEGNGAGLVAPVTVVYQLRAELEIARGALADSERKVARLTADLDKLRAEYRGALERSEGEVVRAMLAKLDLAEELRTLRP